MKQSVSQSRFPSPRCWTLDECDHPPSDLGEKRKEKEAKGMTQQQEARHPCCVDNECQRNKMKKTLIPSTTYFQDIHNLQCFGWVILGINATGMPFPVKKGIILHNMCNFYVNWSWNEISKAVEIKAHYSAQQTKKKEREDRHVRLVYKCKTIKKCITRALPSAMSSSTVSLKFLPRRTTRTECHSLSLSFCPA